MLFSCCSPNIFHLNYLVTSLQLNYQRTKDLYVNATHAILKESKQNKEVSMQTKVGFITSRFLVKDILQEGRTQRWNI